MSHVRTPDTAENGGALAFDPAGNSSDHARLAVARRGPERSSVPSREEVSMKVASSVLACTAVSAIVLACGSSSSDVPKGPAGVTDATLEAIAGSFCDRVASCYGDFFAKAF